MPDGEGVLERALRVLGCFSEDDPSLTAAEIAVRTGLASSTLHRLLAVLVAEGLVARGRGHTYTVGTRLWELGELSPLSLRLRETALPHMLRLYEATGENVHLGVLDAATPESASLMFVGRITGQGSVPTLGREGGRHPLHTTGVGKALLATRDDEWLARYLGVPLLPETTKTIVDPHLLHEDIAHTRARGYAVTHEEMTLGNVSVAAALAPVAGLPPIAIGLVVHIDRADERRLAPIVQQSARDLHHALRQAH